MQLELNFLEPISNIRIIHTLHKHSPAMRMVRWYAVRLRILDIVEWSRGGAIDERTHHLHALDALLVV